MRRDFAEILTGLMTNRRLTARVLSRASGRAESTIRQLVAGAVAPTAEILQDIAPALAMSVADLLVIAGLPSEHDPNRPAITQPFRRLPASWPQPRISPPNR
ncbi:helix-turn-helix domain-containing protein [Phytohabitans aurantiacus]|uniref:HTH cro/C1-type domain-containing protein n=1 Tax=Phytohabitans aurantiacus TaxID=3016789 RepID=A0ABQ5QVQ5_9ACTN|nr:hypothetical protein Pa4123_39230 [Phytohabitans aurantiacus]